MNGSHFRQPIGHTCPDIDKVIKSIEEAVKLCRVDDRYTVEELISTINDIEWKLDIINQLEVLRSSNDILRDWGKQEALRVDELEQELEDANAELDYQKQIEKESE